MVFPSNRIPLSKEKEQIANVHRQWVSLKSIVLGGGSQTHKTECCVIPFMWNSRGGESMCQKSDQRLLGAREAPDCKGTWEPLQGDGGALCPACGGSGALYTCYNSLNYIF